MNRSFDFLSYTCTVPTAAYFNRRCNPYSDNFDLIIQFWRGTIQPSEFGLDIIENGCKIPFKETSLPCKLDNRSSANKNRFFVEEEIKKLLESCCIEELDKP